MSAEKLIYEYSVRLFNDLNKLKINYCHWKSNEHLIAGLNGLTDIDLLVDNSSKHKLVEALKKYNFVRINSKLSERLPGISHYIGFDELSGRLLHLHIHYKLILGEKKVKNYHLPLESFILANTEKYNNIYIPKKEIELLLLIIRVSFKTDRKKIFFSRITGRTIYPKNIIREFQYLLENYNEDKYKKVLEECKLKIDVRSMLSFIYYLKKRKENIYTFLKLKKDIRKSMKEYRRYNGLICQVRVLRSIIRNNKIVKKIMANNKKNINNGGKIIAIVGPDGSGKTTISKKLKKWLGWKINVKLFYFGIPKNKYLKLIKVLLRIINKLIKKMKIMNRFLIYIYYYISAFRWIKIAKNRFNTFKKIKQYREKGCIVITDRYPLNIFKWMNNPMDEARIRSESDIVKNKYIHKEEKYYKMITLPDTILVIKTDIEKLRQQKNDITSASLKQKVEAVNNIKENNQFLIINGNKSLDDVLLDIKRKLWAVIS